MMESITKSQQATIIELARGRAFSKSGFEKALRFPISEAAFPFLLR
jgi:hypothetical protein